MTHSGPLGRRELVDALLEQKHDHYEVWRYFEDRADRLGERLWSTGVWLMSLIAATLVLPFAARLITVPATGLSLQVSAPIPVALIAIFGIAVLAYAYFALRDIREHIESNWERSRYALTGDLVPAHWGGRKSHGWNVLAVIGGLASAAFVGLLILAGCNLVS